jgi:hypothetical protein
MKSLLFLDDYLRKFYISEIETFIQVFNSKLFPAFSDIDQEAEQLGQDYYNKGLNSPCDENFDPADLADWAMDKSISHYSDLSLVKYEFTAISIATLYLIWEQQVRRFLFNEMSQVFEIEYTKFCSNGIEEIKSYFKEHNVDIENLNSWANLDELRLLCNVIKHGDGISAQKLFKNNKELFKTECLIDDKSLNLDTTLLNESLEINQDIFNKYGQNILAFWNELPDRSYETQVEDKS